MSADAAAKVVDEKAAKVLDEKDENVICFCSIQLLDRDGIGLRTKGSSVGAPVHLVSDEGADTVVLEAAFEPNDPLFYLAVRNEEAFYIFGQFWMDGAKHSADKEFCSLVPVMTQTLCKAMEKSGTPTFTSSAACPFIRNSTTRQIKVTGTTAEKKFTTKLAGLRLEIPRDVWMEFKAYRLRLWQAGKNWAGADEPKKDDKDKDKDKKEGEEAKKDDKKDA